VTTLKLACITAQALPLFEDDGHDLAARVGYEPAAAALVADAMGYDGVEWVLYNWEDMIPAVQRHEVDAVWCGQGITPARQAQVDFTLPYAIFNETVLVRAGTGATTPEDLVGLRVGAIAGSSNMALAETFAGVTLVPFTGDDVFGQMIRALRQGEVDAFVDDDVVTIPLGDDPDFEVAFTAPTRIRWGVGVAKDRPDLLAEFNRALDEVTADGRLAAVWREWLPYLEFPLAGAAVAA